MNLPYLMISCSQRIDIFDSMLKMIHESMSVFEKKYFLELILYCDNADPNQKNFLSIRDLKKSYVIYKSKSFEKKITKVYLSMNHSL